jgi:hypothetical protein
VKKTTAALQDFLNARCGNRRSCESYKRVIDVSVTSVACGKHFGQDGILRLQIEFVDRFFPLEGIE